MLLRCSAANRWWKCAFSTTKHPSALPERDTEAADDGTCAAWVAEVVINGDATTAEDMLGKTHQNGVMVDEDMVRHVQTYLDIVQRYENTEAECYGEIVFPGDIRVAGTADVRAWEGSTRRIVDLKYGYEPIEPTSKQLLCYAIIDWVNMTDEQRARVAEYRVSIVQPRAQHRHGINRELTLSLTDLNNSIQELSEIVANIHSGVQHVGSHCKHCTLAAGCEALTQSVYAIVSDITGRAYLEPTGQQLADELAMLDHYSDLLKARKAAVEAEAEGRLARQEFIPGWAMVETIGKTAWRHQGPAIQMLTGIDPYESKLVTPAEMRRRGAKPEVLEKITYRPVVGRKLSRVNQDDIARMFK